MVFSTKKRFIAGVICPKCSAMDKLQAYSEEGADFRECVSCGFKPALTQLKKRLLGKLAPSALWIPRVNSPLVRRWLRKAKNQTRGSYLIALRLVKRIVFCYNRAAQRQRHRKKLMRNKNIIFFELPRRNNRCRKERERFSWVC
jgi:uncharacterized metal-binding protein (TIGR02443 family)